ncbi:MAG TPA: hypothetical protein GXZ21_06160 [Clostridiales bacterium]|nr:hypothetical protein [Clostridiales bacterium]
MKVIIYGAGQWGKVAYDLCKLIQFEVIAFLDRDKHKQGKNFEDTNIKVFAPPMC